MVNTNLCLKKCQCACVANNTILNNTQNLKPSYFFNNIYNNNSLELDFKILNLKFFNNFFKHFFQ